jgi:hypothetical protein
MWFLHNHEILLAMSSSSSYFISWNTFSEHFSDVRNWKFSPQKVRQKYRNTKNDDVSILGSNAVWTYK